MKATVFILLLPPLLLCCVRAGAREGFKAEQLRFPRIREACAKCEPTLMAIFERAGESWPPHQVHLRVFKSRLIGGRLIEPGEIELWARSAGKEGLTLIRTWPVAAASGRPGPKRREGDLQVPEGFYVVDRFNPASSFHLSLGLDYPNRSDRIRGDRERPGGDIFIHGSTVTIGCVPLTDAVIELVYLSALEARNSSGLPVRCDIFPVRMTDAGMESLSRAAGEDAGLLEFWQELRPGYSLFEKTRLPVLPTIDARGAYCFDNQVSRGGPSG